MLLVILWSSAPGEGKAAGVEDGLEGGGGGFALRQAVQVVHVVLQAAIVVGGGGGHGLGE